MRPTSLARWLLLSLAVLSSRAWALEAWLTTPTPTYSGNVTQNSFNPIGLINSVTHLSLGHYKAHFTGMPLPADDRGNITVTALGANNVRCQLFSWTAAGSDIEIEVYCHAPHGAQADSRFVAWFVTGEPMNTKGLGYAHVPFFTSGTATIDPGETFNSTTGAVNTATRLSLGVYAVEFPGLGLASHATNAQVTSVSFEGSYCKAAGWSGSVVSVLCFDKNGAAADRGFNIRYNEGAIETGPLGFVWANLPTNPGPYTPMPAQSFNLITTANSSGTSGTGNYVQYGALPLVTSSVATVTALSSNANYCKLVGFSGTNATVTSQCYGASGAAVHEQFSEAYQALASCNVPGAFAPHVVGEPRAHDPACSFGEVLARGEGCNVACDVDYRVTSTVGGGYSCPGGFLRYLDPVCKPNVQWHSTDWTPCDGVKQTRTTQCVGIDTGAVFADSDCTTGPAGPKPELLRACGGIGCVGCAAENVNGTVTQCMYGPGNVIIGCVPSTCVSTGTGVAVHQTSCHTDPATGYLVFYEDAGADLACVSARPNCGGVSSTGPDICIAPTVQSGAGCVP